METLCTVIGINTGTPNLVECCVPLKEALERADALKVMAHFDAGPMYESIRVYAESANGTVLTLIYQPT